MRFVGAISSPAIRLSQIGDNATSPRVQVLRVGSFNHPKYGQFDITKQVLSEMKANFDRKIRGIDIAFDYFHESDKEASGWPTELYLMEDGNELWAKVDWTPNAQKKLTEREIRYFSPDFAFKWEDPETGASYNNVLFGGGLTNRPFVKEMAAIVAAEGEEMKTLEELSKEVKKLSDAAEGLQGEHEKLKAAHAALQKEHGDLKAKMAEMQAADGDPAEPDADDEEKKQLKAKLAEYEEKAKKAEEAKQMAEKELAFSKLLSEGKAVAAQKESFVKGDMNEFIKLAQPVNLGGTGHGGGTGEQAAGQREDRILKLAEEKMSKDSKLSRLDAINQAAKEIK